MHPMTTNVYVLKLQGGNYYVGKSDDVIGRFQEHMSGNGSAWTRKHKPISIVESRDGVSVFEEDKVTKEYMAKYGIDKVRGGSYSQIDLTSNQKEMIQSEIKGATDACQQCGEIGHFIRYCPNKNKNKITTVSIKTCYTCGNSGHYSNECKNNEEDEKDEDEQYELEWQCEHCDRTFTTAFGCGVHEKSCKEKNKKNYVKQKSTKGACYRCGNTNHYSPDCYATRHVKGYELD
jgi:predicted GIY-YIG superfamily endonuclease